METAGTVRAPMDDARLCAVFSSALSLTYDPRLARFLFRPPDSTTNAVLTEVQLVALLSKSLAQHPGLFPMLQLQPRGLKRLIGTLKTYCAPADDDPISDLRLFVTGRIVHQPGRDVTSSELCTAYVAFIGGRGGSPLSAYQFHRQLPTIIKERFGIAKRHEIPRPDATGRITKRNGWRGLQLIDQNDANDSNDGNDGTSTIPPNRNPIIIS